MKLKKASAWYYNKGTTNVVIDELGIMLHKGKVVDLFKIKPDLTWAAYQKSVTIGVLAQKQDKLIHLPGPPVPNPTIATTESQVVMVPMQSRARTALVIGNDEDDYMATIEAEFPASDQPVPQEELWNSERDKYLKTLDASEQGEDGEVFSDNLFDEEYLADLSD